MTVIIAIVCTVIVTVPITWQISKSVQVKKYEAQTGSAKDLSKKIIDDALATAESIKRDSINKE